MKLKSPALLRTFLLALIPVLAACGGPEKKGGGEASAPPPAAKSEKNITVKGSDTMVNLAQRWAEVYMKEHPGTTIQVTGGGSGTGIAALINGTTDIANSSRPLKAQEKEKAQAQGGQIQEFAVAYDGLAVVVSASNPLKELSLAQLKDIYTGKYNDWKEVGGNEGKIIRYCRESNSGTYVFFKEHVLGNQDYAPDCQTMPGTAAIAEALARDPRGIGYGGDAYFETRSSLKLLPLKKDDQSAAISPLTPEGKLDMEAIRSMKYPLSRSLYIYTLNAPTGETKAFIDWILAQGGQQIVGEVGYVPLGGGTAAAQNTPPAK
ncbi:MAG: PstS family phosphate ABC transporter substrate-binding protein [bacterium]